MQQKGRKNILDTPYRKKRRRRLIIRRLLILSLLLVILITGIVYFFKIPQLQVRDISVIGVSRDGESDIVSIALENSSGYSIFFIPKTFVLAYPKKDIEKVILEKHQDYKSVEVRIRGTSKVEIEAILREPFVRYCATACYYLDDEGVLYQEAEPIEVQSNLVTFNDERIASQNVLSFGTVPLDIQYLNAIDFVKNIAVLGLKIEAVVIEEEGGMHIETDTGKLVISPYEDFNEQGQFLKTALSQTIFKNEDGTLRQFNYIDLRFGKKIFYKFEPDITDPQATPTDSDTEIDTTDNTQNNTDNQNIIIDEVVE